MSAKLVVNPKDYKLKCPEEVLKNLKPYFELKSSSYSHITQAPSLTNGQASSSQQSVQPKHEAKTSINLTLRDSITGELLGKGSLVYDHTAEKPEKFEEKVALKDILGNEVGEATLEIQQIKPQQPQKTIEDEFRRMRKEMQGMMRATNRMFDSFSKRHFGRDWGFGLLDDFSPMMLLGGDLDANYDYEEHHPKEKVCDKCHCNNEGQKKEVKGESLVEKLQNSSVPIVELASEAQKENVENRGNEVSGFNLWGEDWLNLIINFANSKPEQYYSFMNAAYYFFEKRNFEAAGAILGLKNEVMSDIDKDRSFEKSTEL